MSKDDVQREPSTRRMVAFRDCDAFGMLYNTRYLDYVLDARSEQLIENYGIDYLDQYKTTNATFVVQSHKVAYLEPARAHEKIVLRSRVIKVGHNHMFFEGQVLDQQESRLKYVQWTKMVYINVLTGSPQLLSPEELETLNAAHAVEDVPENDDFDARVKQLRSRYRPAQI
jgi:YbgC/YbaW family acyl-CoA thioester hydrolase